MSIYEKARQMTEQEYDKLFATLTQEQKKGVASCIRLGDSKELAILSELKYGNHGESSFTERLAYGYID